MKTRLITFAFVTSLAYCVHCQGQESIPTPSPAPSPTPVVNTDCLKGQVKTLKGIVTSSQTRDEKRPHVVRLLEQWPVYLCYLDANGSVRTQLVGRAEPKRLDKQPGAPSNAAGTTSLVDKGSAPWLLGFALEHGGLTQDVDGNTITFRGNLVNSIRALLESTYVQSFDLGADDPLVVYLSKLSFGVSFDTTSNQGTSTQGFSFDRNTFSGATAKYELINHRDPRDKKWRADWNALAAVAGVNLAAGIGNLDAAMRNAPQFSQWQGDNADKIVDLPPTSSDQDLQQALEGAVKDLQNKLWSDPGVQAAVARFNSSTVPVYLAAEDAIFTKIKRSPIVTLDYSFVRQSLPQGQTITTAQPGQTLPDLSNLTLVLQRGFGGANAPELTFNAAGTFFSGSAAGGGKVRDYRASLQLDVPLREIQGIGQPTLSFSGQYMHLLAEPLGQVVSVNGVTITRTGGIGVFQTKLSIPVKDSGVKIPISFTYSNRTELVKETEVRGNVGITFDFDSLFAKSK